MAKGKFLTVELRNGEKRLYQGITRVDDTRRHLILVFIGDELIAQLNKHDVTGYTFEALQEAAEEPAETAEETA